MQVWDHLLSKVKSAGLGVSSYHFVVSSYHSVSMVTDCASSSFQHAGHAGVGSPNPKAKGTCQVLPGNLISMATGCANFYYSMEPQIQQSMQESGHLSS